MAPDDEVAPGKPEGVRAGNTQTRDAKPATRSPRQPKVVNQSAPRHDVTPTQSTPAPADLATVRGRPVGDPIKSAAKRGSGNLMPHLEKQQAPQATKPKPKQVRNARETETLVSKLNMATRDLTEAFEDTLPADLERKFNAGQAHVYTHRLYKARGQNMYNMVAQGYKHERLIRGRVDAYIRLFERLLDTVSETANGEEMVDACLASESGKLYLLFAQAAGRLS